MSSTRFRADKVSELMDRIRQQHEATDVPADDGFERAPTRPTQTGLHTPAIDVERAYSDNLALPSIDFRRRRQRRHRVMTEAPRAGGLPLRQSPRARLQQNRGKGADALPGFAVREMALEQAINLIEDRARAAARGAPTRVGHRSATAAAQPGATPAKEPTAATPHPVDTIDDGTAPQPRSGDDQYLAPTASPATRLESEETHADFEYTRSAFLALADGARAESGEGAPFFDPERTQTIVFGRPTES